MTEFNRPEAPDARDERAAAIIERHTLGAAAAMFAVPVPGADIAATAGVFAHMTREVAAVYGYALSRADAARLSSELFKSVVLTIAVWFGSAKLATTILKFIPWAGTLTAYVVDAAIAAFGAKRVTAALGTAVALYFKSGREAAPKTLAEHVRNVAKDPAMVREVLRLFQSKAPGGGKRR